MSNTTLCKHCGSSVSISERYCFNCGKQINSETSRIDKTNIGHNGNKNLLTGIIVLTLLIIVALIIFNSNPKQPDSDKINSQFSQSELISQNNTKQASSPKPEEKCDGIIMDIEVISRNIKMGSMDTIGELKTGEMLIYGILKKPSNSCYMKDIKFRITLRDNVDDKILQTEDVILKQDNDINKTLFIAPKNTGGFKAIFKVYDSLLEQNIYTIFKQLKSNVKVQGKIISAGWSIEKPNYILDSY